MENRNLACAAIVAFVAGLPACNVDGPTSPTLSSLPGLSSTAETAQTARSFAPISPNGDTDAIACDIIGTKCAQNEVKVEGAKVSVFILDDYEGEGNHIFHLWPNGLNEGEPIGNRAFPAGKWVELPDEFQPGNYRFKVADEIDLDGDGLADDCLQCDKCFIEFTIEKAQCPTDAYIDFKFFEDVEPMTVGITAPCPEYESVGYVVNHNMDRVELNLPQGCNEQGACRFPIGQEDYTVTGKAVGFCTVDGAELECGSGRDTHTVKGCRPCTACVDAGLPTAVFSGFAPYGNAYQIVLTVASQKPLVKITVTQNGDTILDFNGSLSHSPFEWELKPVDCDGEIEVAVEMYDDSCGEPVLCGTVEAAYSPECPACANVTLETKECTYEKLDVNEYSVTCKAKAIGGTENWFGSPIGSGYFPSDVWFELDFDADCEEEGEVAWEVSDGDMLCKSEIVYWETPGCEEEECDLSGIDEGCYVGNIDTAQHLYDRFGVWMELVEHTGGQNESCTSALVDADLVIVKGGDGFNLYLGVKVGDQICTCEINPQGHLKDISHISYFRCEED